MKIVINDCFGGFGLSDAAYEQLIAWGVPVRKYNEQKKDPTTNLYLPEPANDGEVIFDRELTPLGENVFNDLYHKYKPNAIGGRYWDSWTRENRSHPLVVRVVEALGAAASGKHSCLKVVEIPDGVDYSVEEYDGQEHIAERHRTWA
jgi:hypothetical protein